MRHMRQERKEGGRRWELNEERVRSGKENVRRNEGVKRGVSEKEKEMGKEKGQ